jgi:hypothetical protein
MSNWTAITADDLKAAGYGTIVDVAQTRAVGGTDPVVFAISSAVARVRRSVQAANALDVDPTKVPNSLEALTVRLALYALCERIGQPLTDDQRDTKRNDNSDLMRIADRKVRVEPADNPDANAGPVNPGMWNSERKLIMRTHPTPAPGVQFPSDDSGYANPDAPTDATS